MGAVITVKDDLTIDDLCRASRLFSYMQIGSGQVAGSFFSLQFQTQKTALRSLRFPTALHAWDNHPMPHLLFILQVAQKDSFRFNGTTIEAESPLLLRGHHQDGVYLVIPHEFRGRSFMFDRQAFIEQVRTLYQREPWPKEHLLAHAIPPEAYRDLLNLHRVLERMAKWRAAPTIFANQLACATLEKEITLRILEAINYNRDDDHGYEPGYHLRLVNRVIDYMQANLEQPLHAQDFCRVAQSPLRTLSHAFQQVVEMPPMQYFRRLRLNEAYRRLHRQEGSVTQVATALGFWHLGQFSQDFKKLFGIKPNQVKRRAIIAYATLG